MSKCEIILFEIGKRQSIASAEPPSEIPALSLLRAFGDKSSSPSTPVSPPSVCSNILRVLRVVIIVVIVIVTIVAFLVLH